MQFRITIMFYITFCTIFLATSDIKLPKTYLETGVCKMTNYLECFGKDLKYSKPINPHPLSPWLASGVETHPIHQTTGIVRHSVSLLVLKTVLWKSEQIY